MSHVWNRFGGRITFILILALSSVLLISNLGNQYLWQDEAQTALIAKTVLDTGIPMGHDGRNSFSQDFGAEIDKNGVWKYHTWLPFYILAAFFKLFGTSTFVARLPFVLFGIGTVLLLYAFACSYWKSRRAGVAAALLLLMSVPFLILCRQCRYYAPEIFLSLLGLYSYYGVISGRRYASAAFVASSVLLFHTQYLHFFTLLFAVAAYTLILRRDLFFKIAVLCALSLVPTVPWLIWIQDVSTAYAKQYGWNPFNPQLGFVFTRVYLYWLFKYVFPPLPLIVTLTVGIIVCLQGRRLRRPSSPVMQKMLLPALFIAANLLILPVTCFSPFFRHLGPLIPAAALMLAYVVQSAMKLHILAGVGALAVISLSWPMGEYIYEITHDFDGPVEGMVKYLKANAGKDDVVAVTYDDLPLKFYTNLRIVGGLTGEDLSPAKDAEWVIFRKHLVSEGNARVAAYFAEHLDRENYEAILLEYPDTTTENRETPYEHLFRTVTDERPVRIFRRVSGEKTDAATRGHGDAGKKLLSR